MTALMQEVNNDPVSESIVFGFSIASFLIIVCVVIYEVFQPLLNFEKYNKLTKMEYYKRYNREEYERLKAED